MARSSRASTSSASASASAGSSSRKSTGGAASTPKPTPSTCTPAYTPILDRPFPTLTGDEQLDVVTQLMGFPARKLLFDIHEAANAEIFNMLDMLQKGWLDDRTDMSKLQETYKIPPNITELKLETEAATGMLAMETLLTSQMDAAMELFMAWSYRNAFTVGEWGGVVLPAHEGLDFPRGQYVAEQLPGGEPALDKSIDALRAKVEQKRLLLRTLEKASLRSKNSLSKAKALSDELAFFTEAAQAYQVSPLPETLATLVQSLTTLQASLASLPPPSTLAYQPSQDGEAGLGRAAFINRVVERSTTGCGTGAGAEERRLKEVEGELSRVGRGIEDLE